MEMPNKKAIFTSLILFVLLFLSCRFFYRFRDWRQWQLARSTQTLVIHVQAEETQRPNDENVFGVVGKIRSTHGVPLQRPTIFHRRRGLVWQTVEIVILFVKSGWT